MLRVPMLMGSTRNDGEPMQSLMPPPSFSHWSAHLPYLLAATAMQNHSRPAGNGSSRVMDTIPAMPEVQHPPRLLCLVLLQLGHLLGLQL